MKIKNSEFNQKDWVLSRWEQRAREDTEWSVCICWGFEKVNYEGFVSI